MLKTPPHKPPHTSTSHKPPHTSTSHKPPHKHLIQAPSHKHPPTSTSHKPPHTSTSYKHPHTSTLPQAPHTSPPTQAPHTSTLTKAPSHKHLIQAPSHKHLPKYRQPHTSIESQMLVIHLRQSNHHPPSLRLCMDRHALQISVVCKVDTCGGLPFLVLSGQGVVVALEATQLTRGHWLGVCQLCIAHQRRGEHRAHLLTPPTHPC